MKQELVFTVCNYQIYSSRVPFSFSEQLFPDGPLAVVYDQTTWNIRSKIGKFSEVGSSQGGRETTHCCQPSSPKNRLAADSPLHVFFPSVVLPLKIVMFTRIYLLSLCEIHRSWSIRRRPKLRVCVGSSFLFFLLSPLWRLRRGGRVKMPPLTCLPAPRRTLLAPAANKCIYFHLLYWFKTLNVPSLWSIFGR